MWDWLKRLAPRATIKRQIKTQRRGGITTQRTVLTGVDLHLWAPKPRLRKAAPAAKPAAKPLAPPRADGQHCGNCGRGLLAVDRFCPRCCADTTIIPPTSIVTIKRSAWQYSAPYTRIGRLERNVLRLTTRPVDGYTRADGTPVKGHERKMKVRG